LDAAAESNWILRFAQDDRLNAQDGRLNAQDGRLNAQDGRLSAQDDNQEDNPSIPV
jgi:hypothetical protein